jgi:hypothetical protein
MTQGVGPEFEPHYWKKQTKNFKEKMKKIFATLD